MKASPQAARSESQQSRDVAQRRDTAHGILDNRPQSDRLRQLKEMATGGMPMQRAFKDEDEHLTDTPHNQHPASLKANGSDAAPAMAQRQARPDGLPAQLKAGIESMSGMSMDHVKVHYNSSQPAQLNAHAFAQGSDIHVAPGQEHHLPHEAWHVVQQAQGRVQATAQMKTNVAINDDKGLEHEADVMGVKALHAGQLMQQKSMEPPHPAPAMASVRANDSAPVQAKSHVWNYGQAFTWGGNSTIVGKKMEAKLDPKDPVQGESANINTDQTPLMEAMRTYYGIKGGDLVKGHLLNDNLGGKALNNNLFPITRAANKQHLITTENYAKDQLWTKQSPIWYTVEVSGAANDHQSVHQFDVKLGHWDIAKDIMGPAAVAGSITSDLGSPKDAGIANSDNLDAYSAATLKTAMSKGLALHPHTTVGGMSADEKGYRDHSGLITNTEHKAKAYTSWS